MYRMVLQHDRRRFGRAASFSHGQNEHPQQGLTRDYGTSGSRRAELQNGKPFTLAGGKSLDRRVGVLVHRGSVESGEVARRYQQYMEGTLCETSPAEESQA